MGRMNPLLYKTRQLIKQIKKINKDVFPIEIPNGIYSKPDSSFFKQKYNWKYITNSKIGYLQTVPRLYDVNGHYVEGSCGCMLSDFDDRVKTIVVKVLEEKLEEINKEKE